MQEVWSIGPFHLRSDWLLLLVAVLAGYTAVYLQLKRRRIADMKLLSILADALLLVFVVWKLSPLLFTPSLLWKSPSALLWMNGSIAGIGLGIAVAWLYAEIKWRRLHLSRWLALDLLAIGAITGTVLYNLMGWRYGVPTTMPWGISITDRLYRYHPLNLYMLVVAFPLGLRLWRHANPLGEGRRFADFLLYLGMGMMAVSFFAVKQPLTIGISIEQTGYATMMVMGLYLNWRAGKKIDTKS